MAGGGLPTGTMVLRQRPRRQHERRRQLPRPMSAGGAAAGACRPCASPPQPSGATTLQHRRHARRPLPGRRRPRPQPADQRQHRQRRRHPGRPRMHRRQLRLSADGRAAARTAPGCRCARPAPAIISQPPGGELRVAGRIANPALTGRLGSSPMRLNARSILLNAAGLRRQQRRASARQDPARRSLINASTLRGTFAGGGARGTLGGADAMIGERAAAAERHGRPLALHRRAACRSTAATLVSDRADPPRFYPLRSNDVALRAGRQPDHAPPARCAIPAAARWSPTSTSEHNLDSGAGNAALDVPGIPFGPNLQPERAHPADRRRRRAGQGHAHAGSGRINWSGERRRHLDRRLLDARHGPGGAVRAGHRPDHHHPLHRPARARNGAGAGGDRRVDQPRHRGRRTAPSATSCCPTSWSRSSAANGRSWAAA